MKKQNIFLIPSVEKYDFMRYSLAPADRLKKFMDAASVKAPPNPLTDWRRMFVSALNLSPAPGTVTTNQA